MKTPTMSLNQNRLSRFEEAIQKEWIVTNGLGGFSSSTVLGINTRKYHGLLVAALRPPADRRVFLARLDEEARIGNDVFPLYSNERQNGISPQGHIYLKEFATSPFPTYVYSVQNVDVQKAVFMPYEKNAVVALYKVLNKSDLDVKIRISPLLNWRHFHSVTSRAKTRTEPIQKHDTKRVCVSFHDPKSTLVMEAIGGQYSTARKWLENIYYREEAKRGESCLDDCYQIGFFEFIVKSNRNENFAVTTVADEEERNAQEIMASVPNTFYDMSTLSEREGERRASLSARFIGTHSRIPASDWLGSMVLAADSFVVRGLNEEQRFVIAGYHWFETWGRDAFVSLPGLMLVTGRFEDARNLFLTYKKHCKQGLIPNFIPDQAGQPAYNSADGTLWYVNAILQYLKYTGDFKFVQEQLWETLKAIIEDQVKGTTFNIQMDADGLLSHGERLTWMDAVVDGQAVTPRGGKAVEIQALWYNSLKTMELLADRFKEKNEFDRFAGMAEKARGVFAERFWDAERGYLFDVICKSMSDASLRPNQVFPIALDFPLLDSARGEKVLDIVQRELLTPFGLRTLAKSDPKYRAVYAGDRTSRDKAYHNGTVWPWLLGPLTTAFLKVKGRNQFWRDYAMKTFLLRFLSRQASDMGLGLAGEIFDGDIPHAPRGCIMQAWSVAEPLRAYVEDIMEVRPPYEALVLGS